MKDTTKNLLNKIFASANNYDDGECGSLIRTIAAQDASITAYGVITYDGELAHIIGSTDSEYFDGAGIKTEDDIRAEWDYGYSPELVRIVPVELIDGKYVYDNMSIDADIIEIA